MKKSIAVLLILAIFISALPVSGAELGTEGIYHYHISGGEATFLSADRSDEPLVIPETLGGCPVTAIGPKAFAENTQEPYLVIPASVTKIDSKAFDYLHIRIVYLLGKQIDYHGNRLNVRRMYVHEDVLDYEDEVWTPRYIVYLEDFPCDPRELTQVEEGGFCYALWKGEAILLSVKTEGTVVVPDTLGGAPVTYVGPFCFSGQAVTLPDTVKSIGSYAFGDVGGLGTLTRLPNKLERLSNQALLGCVVQDATLPKGLKRMDEGAFTGVKADTLTVPGSCTHLGSYVFYMGNVKEMILEDGVEYLGEGVFSQCAMTTLTVPGTVTHCKGMLSDRKVIVYGDAGSAADTFCGENGIVFIDRTTGKEYAAPYEYTQEGVKYTIYPDRYAVVSDLAIGYAQNLVIPDTVQNVPVTKVSTAAFTGGTMTSLYLPDTITTMADWGVSGCPNLTWVHMPENLQRVGELCFADNPMLCCLHLPESLTQIAPNAFDTGSWTQIVVSKSDAVIEAARRDGAPCLKLTTDDPIVYGDNAVCKVVDGEAILIASFMTQSGGDDTRTYVIPDEIEGYPVVGISKNTKFIGHWCYNLVLGSNVRYIEEGALGATEVKTLYAFEALESLPENLFPAEGEIYGMFGTYAQTYAEAHSIPFYAMDKLPFTDVAEDAWYYPYVYACYWSELMQGTSATTFAPKAPTNRAMLVTVLWRMCNYESGAFDPGFTDVEYDSWYYEAVKWASSYGIVYGVSPTRFAPKQNITREQTAAILYRFSDMLGVDVETFAPISQFRDGNTASDYAKSALMWAVGAGILQGNSNQMLNPRGYTTRAEMAAILVRFTLWLEAQTL